MKVFPQSVYLFLGLRGLSVATCCLIAYLFYRHGKNAVGDGIAGLLPVWLIAAAPDNGAFLVEYSIDHLAALAAVGAMTFFFLPCRPARFAAASGLALFSIAVTPKYILPLGFGLLGYAAASAVRSPFGRGSE